MEVYSGKKAKVIGTILGILLFSLLIGGITYAWFTWRSSNIDITGTSECFTVKYTKGPSLSNESVLLFDESKIISDNKITITSGMGITSVSAYMDSNCTISGILDINLNITSLDNAFISGNSTGAFKYVVASYNPVEFPTITSSILSGNSFTIISSGSITSTDPIELVSDAVLTTSNTGYLVIFYVDGDIAQNDAQNTTFSGTIEAVATQIEG